MIDNLKGEPVAGRKISKTPGGKRGTGPQYNKRHKAGMNVMGGHTTRGPASPQAAVETLEFLAFLEEFNP